MTDHQKAVESLGIAHHSLNVALKAINAFWGEAKSVEETDSLEWIAYARKTIAELRADCYGIAFKLRGLQMKMGDAAKNDLEEPQS